jgi:hypothetical protein
VAHNSGDRPGGIAKISLIIPFKDKPVSAKGEYDPKFGDGDGFVLPGVSSGKKLRVMFPEVKFDQDKYTMNDVANECTITVTIKEFSGEIKERQFKQPCNELSVVGLRK